MFSIRLKKSLSLFSLSTSLLLSVSDHTMAMLGSEHEVGKPKTPAKPIRMVKHTFSDVVTP